MADFDDSADPELSAACNRLAAWVEPLPEGKVIDQNAGLTERDLAMILRHLYATRGMCRPLSPSWKKAHAGTEALRFRSLKSVPGVERLMPRVGSMKSVRSR